MLVRFPATTTVPATATTTATAATTGATGVYVVQRGDTLSKIAKQLGTTVANIAAKNNIQNVNVIHVGQQLAY
jgi:LysM repeat protein